MLNNYRGYYGNFVHYFQYVYTESRKKQALCKCGYLIFKGIVKPNEENALFDMLDRIFEVEQAEREEETFESITKNILNKVRGK